MSPYHRQHLTMTFLESLRRSRLLGILRGIEFDELHVVAEACRTARLRFVEITMNTKDAAAKIAELVRLADGAFQVGAGTVLTVDQFEAATKAGARFVVSPVLIREVAGAALSVDVPYIPGALTPQDVYECHLARATIVKLFPIQCFGPGYIKELRGPFGDIPLLACGGIRPDNLRTYLDSGADACALGASTFKREWLRAKDVRTLASTLAELVALATKGTDGD
jgi:2-dehydro-3-deoxyphosphogluconate aldolase/(4S)-4-hydroxy-2-oxoglutarate aldolase